MKVELNHAEISSIIESLIVREGEYKRVLSFHPALDEMDIMSVQSEIDRLDWLIYLFRNIRTELPAKQKVEVEVMT